MTPKQQRFIEEYMVDLNATQAAIRAGYSKRSAMQIGEQNLRKLEIKAEIDRRLARKSEETGYTRDRIARMLEEDRALAHENNQVGAAVTASMGLAKLHGLITDKVEKRTVPSEMSDAELERIAHNASRGGNGATPKANGKTPPDSVH